MPDTPSPRALVAGGGACPLRRGQFVAADAAVDRLPAGGRSGFARRFRPAMRIVLVSGYAKGLEDGDAETHGFRFLSKPFTREALANALQDTLT